MNLNLNQLKLIILLTILSISISTVSIIGIETRITNLEIGENNCCISCDMKSTTLGKLSSNVQSITDEIQGNVVFEEFDKPVISNPPDQSFAYSTINHEISWNASDANP